MENNFDVSAIENVSDNRSTALTASNGAGFIECLRVTRSLV